MIMHRLVSMDTRTVESKGIWKKSKGSPQRGAEGVERAGGKPRRAYREALLPGSARASGLKLTAGEQFNTAAGRAWNAVRMYWVRMKGLSILESTWLRTCGGQRKGGGAVGRLNAPGAARQGLPIPTPEPDRRPDLAPSTDPIPRIRVCRIVRSRAAPR